MLVVIPLAAAVTLLSYPAQVVTAHGAGTPAAAQNWARLSDAAARPLAGKEAEETAPVYEHLGSMPHRERVAAFRELPSPMKAAVWRYHLRKALAEHPELLPEQRAIIDDLISFLTPALYDLPAQNPQFKSTVQAPLEEIRRRAWAAFPRDIVVGIFLDLQFRESSKARTSTGTSANLQARPTNAVGYCNCNRNFDDCFFWEGSGSYCDAGCYFTTSYGCGPGFLLNCDGFCTPPDPPT
jgi:hypothetical protein